MYVTSEANSKAEKSVPQPISGAHVNCPEVYFLGFHQKGCHDSMILWSLHLTNPVNQIILRCHWHMPKGKPSGLPISNYSNVGG